MRCFESHTSPLPSPPWTPPSSCHHLHLCCLHLCKKKYCIKLIFIYFLFNADLSKFDSQYYYIRYINSLLLNSRPWNETIKTSTFNFKHKTEQGQSQASKKHLILSQNQCDLPSLSAISLSAISLSAISLSAISLSATSLSATSLTTITCLSWVLKWKKNRKNCVQNMSITALVLAFQNTWFDN